MEDLKGSITVIFFPDIYKKVSILLHSDAPVLIRGIVDVTEESVKVIATEAELLSEVGASSFNQVLFTVNMNTANLEALLSLKELINQHRGTNDASLRLLNNGFEIHVYLGENSKIKLSDNLKAEADRILGSGATSFL